VASFLAASAETVGTIDRCTLSFRIPTSALLLPVTLCDCYSLRDQTSTRIRHLDGTSELLVLMIKISFTLTHGIVFSPRTGIKF
jgi:hypothetical protein